MNRNFLGILTTMTMALLISVPLSAQTIARVTVPFDFTVGRTQMSAGTYEINPLHDAIVIRDTKAAKSALSMVRSERSRNSDSETKLVFNSYSDKYFLSQVSRGRRRRYAASYFQTGEGSTNRK